MGTVQSVTPSDPDVAEVAPASDPDIEEPVPASDPDIEEPVPLSKKQRRFKHRKIFESHALFVVWLTSLEGRGFPVSVKKSDTADVTSSFPYSRINYTCARCKNLKCGLEIKYHFDRKFNHIVVEYDLGACPNIYI